MPIQVESKIVIPTPAQPIFALYADVAGWSRWDPDTQAASLDGPFQLGSRGRLVPTHGRAVPMQLTQLEPGRSFTVQARIPLLEMVFDHELRAVSGGTEATHRVSFTGLLAPLLGRMLAAQLRRNLPRTLASLSRHAQQRHESDIAASPRL